MATSIARTAPTVVDPRGQDVPLGPLLARGGEGGIYPVGNRPDLVAKIYHDPLTEEKGAKLAAMVRLSSERLVRSTAWPVGTLHDRPGGKVRGVLMLRVREHRDLHILYGPKTRLREFPNADLPFLIHAAANVARAFATVHEHGHVIGDVNHGSVLVSKHGMARLVDCDSFQIRDGHRHYLCTVGVPTHTPPELQGRSFAGLVRTANHDAFGLAVLIFQLLFLGRHPFSGGFLGAGELSLERAIGEFRFAYGADAAVRQMRQPPGTPPLDVVSPPVAALFERAFAPPGAGPDGRPSARDWAGALDTLAKGLTICPRHSGHHFPWDIVACPWCTIEATTGLRLFNVAVVRLGRASDDSSFNLEAVWAQIAAVAGPGPPPSLPTTATAAIVSSPAATASGQIGRQGARSAQILAAVVGVLAVTALFADGNRLLIVLVVAFFAAILVVSARASMERAAIEQRLRAARGQLREAERRWREGAGDGAFARQRAELARQRDAYRDLPDLQGRKLRQLAANPRERQLSQYLDRHRIAGASIGGIGPGRKATLQSYGIETAGDVSDRAVLRVPGFGPSLTANLLAWRRGIEGHFVFDPNRGVTPADIAAVEREVEVERAKLEQSLRQGPATLRRIAEQVVAARAALRPAVEGARLAVAQAEADLRTLS